MLVRTRLLIVTVLTCTAGRVLAQGQAQVPPAPAPAPAGLTETINVTATESQAINDALHVLMSSDDRFVATTVADNITRLANAMAASGHPYQIGPLTDQERTIIDLDTLLAGRSGSEGPIRLQPRRPDSTPGLRVYVLTRSALILLFADIASGGAVQVPLIQEAKMIVVGRLFEDLNAQQQAVIPGREIQAGVLRGFEQGDVRGVITAQVVDIADAMAASGRAYDLVPDHQRKAFDRRVKLGEGDVFAKVRQPEKGMVNVRDRDAIYATSVAHFVWFFLRFLLEDQPPTEWTAGARGAAIGGKILNHLGAQLQIDAIEAVIAAVDAAGSIGSKAITLGDFRARGPGLAFVKDAPGLSQFPSALGPDYCVLVISPKEAEISPELTAWLEKRAKDLRAQNGLTR